MKLKHIGEFGLIDELKKRLKFDSSVICSVGDDAAVIKYRKNEYLLFAGDMLVEGVHFKIAQDKKIFAKIGHKAIACNISDIAGMGGIPRYAVVNLGLRPDLDTGKVFELFSGMQKTARRFGVSVVGGDLSRSNKLTVSVSIIGFVRKKNLTLRSGACEGDIIFVTGSLGGSAYGKHLKFTPRLKEAQYLLSKYRINSMIDISDGLVQDLGQILKASNKGAYVYEELLPVSALAKGMDSALYEGEDFELLFTVSGRVAARLIGDKRIKVYRIGEIVKTPKTFKLVYKSGNQMKLKIGGFRHF